MYNYTELGLPDKGCAIKGLVVSNSWDLELNGVALGCYQPSPEVRLACTHSTSARCW